MSTDPERTNQDQHHHGLSDIDTEVECRQGCDALGSGDAETTEVRGEPQPVDEPDEAGQLWTGFAALAADGEHGGGDDRQ